MRRFFTNMRVQMNKLKEKEKNYLAFYTISHRKMILWMKSRNLRKETKKKNIKWTKQNDTKKKKRYKGWLCEHFHETLMILKKSYAKNWNFWKKESSCPFLFDDFLCLRWLFHSVLQSGKNTRLYFLTTVNWISHRSNHIFPSNDCNSYAQVMSCLICCFHEENKLL